MPNIEPRDRLIVALDTADIAAARELVRRLDASISFYKVGLVLQLASGV